VVLGSSAVRRQQPAVWWLQVYGWSAYGLSVYLAMLPALRPAQWLPMLGVKVLRTALGFGASVVLTRVYGRLAGRGVALHIPVVLGGSLILGAAWLSSFELTLASIAGTPWRAIAWPTFPREVIDYSFVLLAWSGAYLGIQLWRSAEGERHRAASDRARLVEVELASLRYQLNPHFLFNALNSVRSSMPAEAAESRQLVSDLSRYLRHTLHSSETALVSLSQECASAESYLAIERQRFDGALTVTVNIDPAVADTAVPCFLLHPLVENAVKHGLPGRIGPMALRVTAAPAAGGGVAIDVANVGHLPGNGATAYQPDGLGIGLRNVRARLDRVYQGRASITLEQDGEWVLARIRIPGAVEWLSNATGCAGVN